MNNTRHIIDLFRFVAAFIIDIITILLVFSIWALINLPVFPIALCIILISVLILDIVIIVPKEAIQKLGISSYTSMLLASIIYYAVIMIFTGFVYSTISPRWYLILTLCVTLLYIAAVTGLYVSGLNNRVDVDRQASEKSKMTDINLKLIEVSNNLSNCCKSLEHNYYSEITGEYNSMKERILASTPFGRISKPVVIDMEDKINAKMVSLNDSILLLKTVSERQQIYEDTMKLIYDIKMMVISREKLIMQ